MCKQTNNFPIRDVRDLYWATIYHIYDDVSNACIQTLNEAKTQRKQAMDDAHANSAHRLPLELELQIVEYT